jgi:CRISPR-associated protein Csx3
MNPVPAWQEVCTELNLKIIALIHSDYNGVADQLQAEEPILKGSIHYFERGQDVSNRPMVQALARLLLRLSGV